MCMLAITVSGTELFGLHLLAPHMSTDVLIS